MVPKHTSAHLYMALMKNTWKCYAAAWMDVTSRQEVKCHTKKRETSMVLWRDRDTHILSTSH